MRLLLPALALFVAAVATAQPKPVISNAAIMAEANPPALSAFGFFDGGADKPSHKLIPYSLGTPLFSDYSEKQRFIYLPPGATISADGAGKLSFPIGTTLVKSFGYPAANGGLKIIETRLLIHRKSGWVALPYVWREDGGDADLRVGGTRIPLTFARSNGQKTQISYAVPNKNQCKQCHSSAGAIMPIGPVWQNMVFARAGDRQMMLRAMPQLAGLKPEAKWDDPASGSVEQRAQAYLRVNCGHCHAPKGSASNSGLFLDGSAKDASAYGIGKRPVAAGRASGDLDFIVEPGKPDRSILITRLQSTEPGIAMPELGRATAHEEGIRLLEEWVSVMKP